MAAKLTSALKAHLKTSDKSLSDASTDKDFNAALTKAIGDGALTAEKFNELSADVTANAIDALVEKKVGERLDALGVGKKNPRRSTLQTGVLVGGAKAGNDGASADIQIRVKSVYEKFNKSRATGLHRTTGQPVQLHGRNVELPSELDEAKMGVWMRHKFWTDPVLSNMYGNRIRAWDDLDQAVLDTMLHEDEFCDADADPANVKYYTGMEVKALLDESGGSGGQGLVPIWFDDMIITFPLLHSELFPYVQIREVPRGSRMVGASLGNPTVSWGSTEGTAFTLFDTTALAAEIDTTIYPVVIGLEMGIDFLSDSPVQVGQQCQENIGQSALKEWDKVIATGNGTNRPQGLTNATLITNNSVNNAIGSPEIDDVENIVFALGKQYRAKPWNVRHVMADSTYKQYRRISVNISDQRRVFGMDHQSYQLLEYPVSVQNDIAAGVHFFVALAKYRLYRRRGFDLRMVTEGITLAQRNTVAIIGRGRLGGKMMDASAGVKMTDLGTGA